LGTEGIRSVELDVSNVSGFSVVADSFYDDRSNCPRLAECLGELTRWSDAHPRHAPIFVLIEAKDPSAIFDPIRDKWDAASLDRLDDAVRAAFSPEQLITPDDVRGDAPTLREAIMGTGWPTLAKSRGKFVVVLNRIKLRRT